MSSLEDPLLQHTCVLDNSLREPAKNTQINGSYLKQKKKTYSAISFSALSTESEPWQTLRPTARQKSPRIEPGRSISAEPSSGKTLELISTNQQQKQVGWWRQA